MGFHTGSQDTGSGPGSLRGGPTQPEGERGELEAGERTPLHASRPRERDIHTLKKTPVGCIPENPISFGFLRCSGYPFANQGVPCRRATGHGSSGARVSRASDREASARPRAAMLPRRCGSSGPAAPSPRVSPGSPSALSDHNHTVINSQV